MPVTYTHTFDTHVQGIKYKAVREMIRAYDQNSLGAGSYLEIAKKALPGPEPTIRCCVYKERAILQERLAVIQKGIDKDTKSVVNVIDIACDECPADGMLVTQACRGCISHKCMEVCPRNAISIVDKHCVIDKEKCIRCGKCASVCPYSAIIKQQRPCISACKVDAISVDTETNKATINEDKCISCGQCVRQCPFGAIQEKSLILECLDLLKNSNNNTNYKVWALFAPSVGGQFTYTTPAHLFGAMKALGFYDVADVALGADVCLEHELSEWQEKGVLSTSCCPAYYTYIQKYFPEFAPNVSHSFSPMIVTAKMLKSMDPTCKTVFVGPCAAKKMECKDPRTEGAIDCVLSFEELQAFLDARNVVPNDCEELAIKDASYFGRIFGRIGGLTAGLSALAQSKGVTGVNPVVMDGLEECKMNLFKAKVGKSPYNFYEGMACVGGCANGPLVLHQSSANGTSVDSYGKNATGSIENSNKMYDDAMKK